MSKPIIPMVSPVMQRAAVTLCGVVLPLGTGGAEHLSLQRMPLLGDSRPERRV